MPTPQSRTAANVDAMLNSLSPEGVAQSISTFTAHLTPADVLEIIRASLPNMDGFERVQLGIAFNAPRPAAAPSTFHEPTVDDADLLALVRSAGDTAPARFARFLSQNVRSLRALNGSVLRQIFNPVSRGNVRFEPLQRTQDTPPKRHRSSLAAYSVIAVTIALAVLAFAATHRYVQRSQVQVTSAPVATSSRVTAFKGAPQTALAVAVRPKPRATPIPAAAVPTAASESTATPSAVPTATASPSPSPTATAVPTAGAAASPSFEDRARRTVLHYLESTQQRDSQFSIINASYNGRAERIVVTIDGPDGRFLGEYTVMQQGDHLAIVDQSLSPQ